MDRRAGRGPRPPPPASSTWRSTRQRVEDALEDGHLVIKRGELGVHRCERLSLRLDGLGNRIVRAIGRPELAEDARFRGLHRLVENRGDVLALLDEAFATRTLDEWEEIFAREDVWWDPLLSFDEVLTDPVVAGSGAFRRVEDDGRRTVATPVDLAGVSPGPAPRAPEAGQHTEEVLLELGLDWPGITELKDRGVVP